MHPPTHIMSGWCIGNLFPFTPRQRLFCMIAATAADVDGVGKIISEDLYFKYHHILGHNLTFAILGSTILAAFSIRRVLSWIVYLALFHLHIFMDLWGSGKDWPIAYWWPFKTAPEYWLSNPYGWDFYSWQNILAAFLFLCWTIWIGYKRRRTPLEVLMPSLDRRLVRLPTNTTV